MPPAARLGDEHICNQHGAGPVLPECCPTVIIGGMPAAREGDICSCSCTDDPIKFGEPTVLIGGRPAARMGDATDGGIIAGGCVTVLVGSASKAACMALASEAGAAFINAS